MIKFLKFLRTYIVITWLSLLIISFSFGLVHYSNESGTRNLSRNIVGLQEDIKSLKEEVRLYNQRDINLKVILNRQTDEVIRYKRELGYLRYKLLQSEYSIEGVYE